MNKPVRSTEIETVITLKTNKKKQKKKQSPIPDGYTGEFYQMFREELMPIILELF